MSFSKHQCSDVNALLVSGRVISTGIICQPLDPPKLRFCLKTPSSKKSWVFDGTYKPFVKRKVKEKWFPNCDMKFNLSKKLPYGLFSAKKQITSPSRNWPSGYIYIYMFYKFYSFLVIVMISQRVTDQQPPYVFNLKPPTYPTGLAASTVLRPYAVGRFHGSSSPVTLALLRAVGCGASPQQLLLHCAAAGCPVLGDRQGGKLGRYRQRYRHPENWWLAYFQVWAVSSRECSH